MNARRNDIHETEFDTFEWMMRDDPDLDETIPKVTQWLSHGCGKFFIQGKAGSGKSTLMKFIFEHGRTEALLRQWSPRSALLFHAFWIAGSRSQKTLRGLITSLVFQIIIQDRQRILELSYDIDTKNCLNDWSTKDLTRVLTYLLQQQSHFYCIFIDGLDEHDDFEADALLELIDDLSAMVNVKICVSSRPTSHVVEWATETPMLTLHELTANDIKAYVTGMLYSKLKSKFATLDVFSGIDRLACEICSKAEGVFVWVYYVMHNVLRGLRIGDDIDMLRKRIADLPSEMSIVYKQMWERQNSDNKVHADEARQMFSYVTERGVHFFEFATFFDAELRSRYISHPYPLSEASLENFCQHTKRKLTARCAGLLECSEEISQTPHVSKGEKSTIEIQQAWWRCCIVKYFHRTAYDFAISAGLATPDIQSSKCGSTCVRHVEASIACFVEEVFDLSNDNLQLFCFGRMSNLEARDLPSVKTCMSTINKIVPVLLKDRQPRSMSLSWPRFVKKYTRASLSAPSDPVYALLLFSICPRTSDQNPWVHGPPRWLSDYLASRIAGWTPYYRGWAIFCISIFLDSHWDKEETCDTITPWLQIVNLIIQQGADLCTPHCLDCGGKPFINSPGSSLLSFLGSLVSTQPSRLDVTELQTLCRHLGSSALPPQCGIWLAQRSFGLRNCFAQLSSSPLVRSAWTWTIPEFPVLLIFNSDELLTAILESADTGTITTR